MSPPPRTGKRTLRLLVPVALLVALAIVAATAGLIYAATHPPQHAYLLTPDTFRTLSDRGLQATDESWTNRDGTISRGWLLRGAEGAPAVLVLHPLGGDRSWYLNLGVKLNEATNYTLLWVDQRGHGENPPVGSTSFGGREASDAQDALKYLRSLKTAQGQPLVGGNVGIYGVELGAYAALVAVGSEASVRALALDSVPASPNRLLHSAVRARTGVDNRLLDLLAEGAARIYFLGDYANAPSCSAARALSAERVLLLSGTDGAVFRDSTLQLRSCFPATTQIEAYTDLPLTGLQFPSATGVQEDAYDRRIINFFDHALRDNP